MLSFNIVIRKDMQFYAFGFNMKKNILIKKRK
jgi:hypothetical protein